MAPIVGLGAMLGKMLELSGGAERIADRLLGLFGQSRAPVALGVTGLIFGVPVFFDVGVIVLAPVVYAAALRGRRSMLYYGMPRPNAPSPGAASTGSFSRRPTSRPGGSPPATSTGARIGGKLVPVGATEFAQDATFGYSSSNLRVRRARAAAYNAVPSRHG